MSELAIPVLELADLTAGDPERLAAAHQALRVGFGEFGLVYVRGHGVDQSEVRALYDDFLDVLDRPTDEKATWGGAQIWYQRGWTPPNTEQAVLAGGQPDFKECYFAAPLPMDEDCRRWYPEIYADNVWPAGADAFQARLMAAGAAVHAVGLALLRGCAGAYGLPAETFVDRVEGGASLTRLLKYLPLDAEQRADGVLWGEEHTDFNLLTLLPGGRFYRGRDGDAGRPAEASGLYLRTRATPEFPNGRLVRGTPPPDCIVAQVGQQLEVLTGGRLLATPHVITAPKEPGWSRASLAHFLHLNAKERVAPLAELAQGADARYWPPVLAGTYAAKTLVDIGLAPPAVLDALGYRHYGRLAAVRQTERDGSDKY